MNCISCSEWFEVVTNTGGPGLCFCPCCGHEFTPADFEAMHEDDDEESES